MKRQDFENMLYGVFTVLTLPFLIVYFAGTQLLKKALFIIAVIFGVLFGVFAISEAFVAVMGNWQEAMKAFADYADSAKNFVFVEIPQDLPNKTNMVLNYLKANPFVRNLVIMWLIGFVIYHIPVLFDRLGVRAARRNRNRMVNTQNFSQHTQDSTPYDEPDPTDGFTKARFDAYFPEGWQERRQDFFNQVKEAKEAVQKRIKRK